jgi:hypothetical protein
MSEGLHGSGEAASALVEKEVAAAVSAPLPSPPPPLASVLAFAATDADAGAAAYFFDDASTIGSTGDASTLVLDSWLRDPRDGHFYCPRHPDQRKPYRPHRNSICAECLAESQRARQSLEQRKRVVEQKLQRLMDDKMAKDDDEDDDEPTPPNRSSNSGANIDAPNRNDDHGLGGAALNLSVMRDWTNSLQTPAPPQANKSSAAARPPEYVDRAELKSSEGSNNEPPPPPPPPIVEATFHYSPPSLHPPQQPAEPQQPPTQGYQPPYDYYAYAPPSAGPSPFNNGQYPSHPPHLSHNLPGYLSDAPPPPAVSHHPTYATPPISPQHQAPPEYRPHASTAPASHMHPSYSEVPSHSSQQGGWAAATATYGSPAPAAAAPAPAAAAVPDAFVGHLFHMMERQDGMLVQKIKECDELKKALDEVTKQIQELRVDNAQLRERVGQQGEQMRHELDLIRREVVAAAAAVAAPTATSTSRPQHLHRTPSPPRRGRRMRRSRTSSAEIDGAQVAEAPRTPLLLADSPHRAREDGASNVARDVLEMGETEPIAPSNESPFLSEENKNDLSGVKLEPTRRKWTSTSSPSGPDLSPPVQWFPFLSEDVKDCPFTVFVDDDNDFHDPFGVGAAAASKMDAKGARGTLKPAPATTNAAAAPAVVAASHRQDIDWERSELAV